MKTFLLEIGTEEIPARFIEPAKEGLRQLMSEGLKGQRISFGDMVLHATPRRMTIFVHDMADRQKELLSVKFGPPLNRAFDESGNPTKAATGFARSQGVEVDDLKKGVKDGTEFITVEKREEGHPATEVIAHLLPDVITHIPFQKKMRWGAGSFEYARPIQWILAILDDKPIIFSVADLTSGNLTYCHRFFSPGPLEIKHPSEYMAKLRDNLIIVDEEERMGIIRRGIEKIETETGGKAIGDDDLIKEILHITEYPYPLKGSFDETYLAIPREVLVNVMKSHQRYIPIVSNDGALMPDFIFFANTKPIDDSNVVKGNEKVLRARLSDGQFFFEEDKKTLLADLYDRLSSIVYHVKLGTLKQKADRVAGISEFLAGELNSTAIDAVNRVAKLAKTDLLTHMVGEFPELQGIMGRIYALQQGEGENVALAIEEHYLPSGGNSSLPRTEAGAIVGISDKMDSLVSFFSVGILPTGNLDPFALRRQALGIIRILIDRKIHLSLEALVEKAFESGREIQGRLSLEETKKTLFDFITTRFKFSMIEEGHNLEFIESVLPSVEMDIYDGYVRLSTLETQKSIEDFKKLMIGFKRAFNITKTLAGDRPVDTSLLQLDEELKLFHLYESKREIFFSSMEGRRYDEALSILIRFKETIDNFFDKVFVMDKDESVRDNRLALLKKIKDMFLMYGDFSKIRID